MPLSRKPTVTMATSPDRNGGVRFVQVGRELDGLGSRIQDPVRGSQEVISHGDGIVEAGLSRSLRRRHRRDFAVLALVGIDTTCIRPDHASSNVVRTIPPRRDHRAPGTRGLILVGQGCARGG